MNPSAAAQLTAMLWQRCPLAALALPGAGNGGGALGFRDSAPCRLLHSWMGLGTDNRSSLKRSAEYQQSVELRCVSVVLSRWQLEALWDKSSLAARPRRNRG